MDGKKKAERKNRKLKKAQAFLALIKANREQNLQSSDSTSSSIDMDGIGTKSSLAQSSVETLNTAVKVKDDTPNPDEHKETLTEDALIEMRKLLRERNKMAMQRPKIFLTPEEMLPYKSADTTVKVETPPVYAIDVQNLLLYALQGNSSSFKPRWCKLLRVTKVSSVVVIFLDGVSYSDFLEDKESFKSIQQAFDTHVGMVPPEEYGSTVDDEIASVPLSISQIKKANVKVKDDIRKQVADKIKPIRKDSCDDPVPNLEKFSRVCLLLSSHQMKQEGYPLPVDVENNMYRDFKFSKDQYTDVTSDSPLFAVDCEMCVTSIHKHELTRVSLINERNEVIYDTLVKPRNPITNYLTRYSGITAELMENVNVRLEDVQKELKRLLPSDAILCGQSLNCDLLALKLFHPYVIDTSVIYNMSGSRGTKAGLRKLTGFFLNRIIQNDVKGHCSVEDAKATLDLVKLKLNKGLEFGDATVNGIYYPSVQSYFLGPETQNGSAENMQQETNKSSHTASQPTGVKRSHPIGLNGLEAKKLKTGDSGVQMESGSWMNSTQTSRIFNQNHGLYVHQSFFKLVEESGRTSCLIGTEDFTSKYEKEPIEKISESSDKYVCKAAQSAVEVKEFTWVNFEKYRKALADPDNPDEYFKSVLQKLDKRVEKVLSKAKEKSLVVLMMTGRPREHKMLKAGIFVKIT